VNKTTPAIVLFALMLIILLSHADAWAIPHPVRVFDDQKQFIHATKAGNVLIPSAEKAFPGSTCGFPLTGRGADVGISFDSNALTVTQVGTVSANGLCIYDKGFSGDGSTIPSLMIANTILGDGVDNYLMTFAKPVDAVGLRLLTNFSAKEQVTLLDEVGHIISTENIDGLTEPNTRQFVGFQTKKTDIKSLLLETSAGQIQNEGIDALWVASDHAPNTVPEPTTLVLWGTSMAGLGLAARWRRRRYN
jgi:MYXO-CTERM domain-containing protein